MREPRQDGIDLAHYVRQAWRHKWLLLAVVVLIPLATYLVTERQAKVYQATTLMQVASQEINLPNQVVVTASGPSETATIVETSGVARIAARELGQNPNSAAGLLGKIDASPQGESTEGGFLTITARDSDPKQAARIANAFAAAISQARTDDAIREIDETIATLSKPRPSTTPSTPGGDLATRAELEQQLQQLRAQRGSLSDTTQVIEPATPPGAPISPNTGRNVKLAFVLSLLIAAGLVPLLEAVNRRLRKPEDLEELSDAPLLGSIPDEAFPGRPPAPYVQEAFQTLRTGLTYFNIDRTLSSVLVASPTRGDGKTTVAANLAVALAQDGRNVIAIDCDLRRPQLATRLGLSDQVNFGVDSVLIDRREVREALVEVEVDGGRLRVLPGGLPPNPSVLLGSDAMRMLLSQLTEDADMVIIDTPPLLPVSDAIPLQEQVSGTVLVARMDQTRRDGVRRAGSLVTTAGGNLLGLVATGVQVGGVGGGDYAYGYGYGYTAENGAGTNGGGRRRSALGRLLGSGSTKS